MVEGLMMRVSNNSLTILLVLAIMISIIGTWLSVSYIDTLNQFTGRATSDVGNTTLTVTGETSCTTASDRLVAFGSLARSATNQSESAGNDFITLENDGNTNINVTVNVTDSTTELWDDGAFAAPSAYWRIRCNNAQSGTCDDTYANVPGPAPSGVLLVYGLEPSDSTDELDVAINVTVPAAEASGTKNGQVTFYCVET